MRYETIINGKCALLNIADDFTKEELFVVRSFLNDIIALRAGEVANGLQLDDGIEVMELSVRSYNCLKRANINTIRDLIRLPDRELKSVRNLGSIGYEEVKRKLGGVKEENNDN